LAAADILPARFALLPAGEGARRLFADLDATLAAQLRAGDVLVAGQHLGAGPGGGEAARALAAAGMIAVVAGSFAPGFAEALLAAPVAGQRVDVERELVAAAGELLDAAPAVADERHGPGAVLGRVRPGGVVAVDERERDPAPQVLAHARDEKERVRPVREHE